MPITERHRAAEARFRRLLIDATLPEPDDVEYEPASVVFYWHAPKVAVFVDLPEEHYVRSAASSSAGGSTDAAESVTSIAASRP